MKKTKSNEKYLLELFHYWCGRFKVPKIVKTIKDNTMDCVCCVEHWDNEETRILKYNLKQLNAYRRCEVICVAFHELGHFFEHEDYNTKDSQIKSEFLAESFALRMMQKHYTKEYQTYCRLIKKEHLLERIKQSDDIYYQAYKQIPEYAESIK
jgi:hypothetical protein